MTRNQWLSMWSALQEIEHSNKALMDNVHPTLGPVKRKQVETIVKVNKRIIRYMKDQIQSEIGQME